MSRWAGSIAAAFVVVLGACGGDDGGSGIGPQTNTCTGTCLVVDNQSTTLTIDQVNYSNCSDPNWGPDRLPGGEGLRPGAARGWPVQTGCWDIRAIARAGTQADSLSTFGVALADGQTWVLVFGQP